MQDHQTSIPLESTSEFYLYGETGPYRSVGMVSILLEGVLDLGKMTQAVETALDHFPALSSTLKEERNGWMYSLFWAPPRLIAPRSTKGIFLATRRQARQDAKRSHLGRTRPLRKAPFKPISPNGWRRVSMSAGKHPPSLF